MIFFFVFNLSAVYSRLREFPLTRCGPLTKRFFEHAIMALTSDFLAPFLDKKGARRDFLAFASKKLLVQRVSLDEAGFLVGVLLKIWKEKQTEAALGERF